MSEATLLAILERVERRLAKVEEKMDNKFEDLAFKVAALNNFKAYVLGVSAVVAAVVATAVPLILRWVG